MANWHHGEAISRGIGEREEAEGRFSVPPAHPRSAHAAPALAQGVRAVATGLHGLPNRF